MELSGSWAIEAWHLWLLLALALAIIDLVIIGVSGVLLALAAGALFGMAAALLGFSGLTQMLTAAFTGLAMMPLFVWLFRRITGKNQRAPRVDSQLGKERYIVVEARGKTGIWILGDFFPVKDSDGHIPPPGETVRVLRFRGITAIVERVPGEQP
jgi:membrane protein implicated in regulation of membrane protease activity